MTSSSVLEARVFPRLYRDSVNLMALASALEKAEGVIRVGRQAAALATTRAISIWAARPGGMSRSGSI